ncbi:LacI family transcriptional regulator [Bifidobacterium longum]|nr:LacI family transcriptional regulator [Bifidobacterium longum]RHG70659.1 LacI family transcriptional regulator [Bifidobacterium longum]
MRYGPWILNTFHKDDPLFQGFANISVPVAIPGVGYGSATPSPPSTSTTDSLHASSPSICWGAGIDESPISSDRRTCRRRRRRRRQRARS